MQTPRPATLSGSPWYNIFRLTVSRPQLVHSLTKFYQLVQYDFLDPTLFPIYQVWWPLLVERDSNCLCDFRDFRYLVLASTICSRSRCSNDDLCLLTSSGAAYETLGAALRRGRFVNISCETALITLPSSWPWSSSKHFCCRPGKGVSR